MDYRILSVRYCIGGTKKNDAVDKDTKTDHHTGGGHHDTKNGGGPAGGGLRDVTII
jgi:hypothetical protein